MLRHLLRQLLGLRTSGGDSGAGKSVVLRPDVPFYAIGDIHGRLDLLDGLLAQINLDAALKLVFLGDYIDRGPRSVDVLKMLFAMAHDRPDQVVCLMGNHERMLLDFIDDPLGRGNIWLRFGGLATLESFRVPRPTAKDDPVELCQALEQALDPELIQWLRQLPLSWQSGNIWCAHAAMDPAKSPTAQRSKTLLWGHARFLKTPRQDDVCVVHGHTIVGKPAILDSRIAVDTGAYQTGCLTAAYVANNRCRFVQFQSKSPN